MSQIIDGKQLAADHEAKLRQQLEPTHLERRPILVSFYNIDDPSSVKYTELKAAKAAELWIEFIAETLTPETTTAELLSQIEKYNADPSVYGILVQMPLPTHLQPDQRQILETILPEKDVDGLTVAGQTHFMPATVKAVISILDFADPNWTQSKIAVVGCTGEVGKPLMSVLTELEAKDVVGISTTLGDINQDLKDRDIVISSTGVNGLVKPEMVKDGFIGIDVGLGDFDQATLEKSSQYTPRIGGVGPMTVISLMENTTQPYLAKTDHD